MACTCNENTTHSAPYVSHYNRSCQPVSCGCQMKLSSNCITYDGSELPALGTRNGDSLYDILRVLDLKLDSINDILSDIDLRLDALEQPN